MEKQISKNKEKEKTSVPIGKDMFKELTLLKVKKVEERIRFDSCPSCEA